MDKRKILMEILSNFVAFALLYNTFAFFYVLGFGRVPWLFAFAAVPFAGFYFMRKKIKDLGIFMISHVFFIALPIFVFIGSGLYMFVIIILFALSLVGFSLACVMKEEWRLKNTAVYAVVGFFTFFFLIFDALEEQVYGVYTLINFSMLFCLLACAIFIHMDNLSYNLHSFKEARKGKTDGGIFAVNNKIIAVFIGITGIFGVASIFSGGNALVFIIRAVQTVIFAVFRLFGMILGFFVSEEIGEGAAAILGGAGGAAPLDPIEFEEDAAFDLIEAFWRIISPVALAILSILIIIAFVHMVIALRKKLQKKEAKSKNKESREENESITKLKFNFGDLTAFLPKFKIDIKHPVRRAFIKKVNKHIKLGVKIKPNHTPEVIAKMIHPQEDIDGLTDMYETVRYGRE